MQSDKNCLTIERSLLVIFYYYVIFLSFIPQFVYKLQTDNGIITPGTIRIEYQVLAYILGIVPIVFIMIPFLKKEKRVDFKKILLTSLFIIVLGFSFNLIFQTLIKVFNNGNIIISENQSGLNILKEQNLFLHHFMVIILAPCLEELVFRGVIFNGIRSKNSFILATFISSFLFGLIHVGNTIFYTDLNTFIYFLLYAGLGFMFCCAYEYNKTLYACIIMHMIYNAWAILT